MSERCHKGLWSPGLWGVLVLTALPAVAVAATDLKERRQEQRLEEQIPLGETRDFYRGLLTGLGYTITSVSEPASDAVEYKVRKRDWTAAVRFRMDQETERATEVAAVLNFLPRSLAAERAVSQDGSGEVLPEAGAPLEDQAVVLPTGMAGETGSVMTRGSRFSDRDRRRVAASAGAGGPARGV